MEDIDIIDTCEHKTLVLGRCNIHTITDWLLFNAKRSAVQLFSWREQVYTQYVMHRWNRWHRWHMWHREDCWLQYTAAKQYIMHRWHREGYWLQYTLRNNISCTSDTGDTGRATDFYLQLPNNISCTGDTGDTGRTTDFNKQLSIMHRWHRWHREDYWLQYTADKQYIMHQWHRKDYWLQYTVAKQYIMNRWHRENYWLQYTLPRI